ncbi:hypothetical protein ABGB16_30040 [Micromonospora sp. B11E3]|uniref:hypothetical protein n=1 Tax=Micromonospora sp. B11E3 TaxID=3153562 RepID=UPI00325C6B6E
MHPVLGGEVVEGEELVQVVGDLGDGLAELRAVGQEDAAADTGLTVAAATLVSETFGLGGLPWGEAPHEGVQFLVAHLGQRRVRQLLDDRGPGRDAVVFEEGEQVAGGVEAGRSGAGDVAVVFEDFTGFADVVGDAGGGDLEQVGQDVHGADLAQVEQGE